MARIRPIRLVFALALGTTVWFGALAADDESCVPFKVHGTPTAVEISGGPPPFPLTVTIAAEGVATHLGHYTGSATFVVVFLSPTSAIFLGGGTLTAADGDELHFIHYGDFFPGPAPGGVGRFEITGGTGRFEGASGSGDFSSMNNETTFDGEICRED